MPGPNQLDFSTAEHGTLFLTVVENPKSIETVREETKAKSGLEVHFYAKIEVSADKTHMTLSITTVDDPVLRVRKFVGEWPKVGTYLLMGILQQKRESLN